MNEEKKQEILMKATLLEKESESLKENISLIEGELKNFINLESNIQMFERDSRDTEVLTNIGKGMYVKAKLEENEIYVNVGSGIIVKKKHSETKEIISKQVKKLNEIKIQLMTKLELYEQAMGRLIQEVREA